MRRLPALVAALLIPVAPPLLLGIATSTAALLVLQAPAQAQSAKTIDKVAQAITVRIEGATQGSGVLVKREGNRYTVLTAWHVVSGQRPGEELEIFTPDGQKHQMDEGSIQRVGDVDMAVLTFTSTRSYEVARIGDLKSVSSGEQLVVAGFPSVSNSRLSIERGRLVANASVGIDQGYQLLYTNHTLVGMSGGVILSSTGELVGTHGRGELDEDKSRSSGQSVKTGINQGVPISYFNMYITGVPIIPSLTRSQSADDYYAEALSLLDKRGVGFTSKPQLEKALAAIQSGASIRTDERIERLMASILWRLGRASEAARSLTVEPTSYKGYHIRALVHAEAGDIHKACSDLRRTWQLFPDTGDRGWGPGHWRMFTAGQSQFSLCFTPLPDGSMQLREHLPRLYKERFGICEITSQHPQYWQLRNLMSNQSMLSQYPYLKKWISRLCWTL
jgi:hypothetical protein